MTQFESFILIGGRSSRLGLDKAFVELGGKTLLERAVDVAKEGSRVTLVAGRATQFAIQAVATDNPFIFDLHENRGPLGGLHAALAYAQTPWIFVLACDYPFVSTELIQLIASKISDEFGAIVPEQNDGRLQPLCAFYRVAQALPLVEEIIERPRVPPPLHDVVRMLNPLIVEFDEYSHLPGSAELFVNVNTRADLDEALKITRKLSDAE
jgi:molybdopterin-guanine dinucleotide biosynthesis protein A